jgi:hypothetical protein
VFVCASCGLVFFVGGFFVCLLVFPSLKVTCLTAAQHAWRALRLPRVSQHVPEH